MAVSVKKLYFKRVQSESCAIHLSTQASKSSKQLQRSQAVRASKETQTKAKRASMCASKACRVKQELRIVKPKHSKASNQANNLLSKLGGQAI